MTVGPSHAYITEGLLKGYDEDQLREIIVESWEQLHQGLPPVLSLKHISHYTGIKYPYLREVVRRQRFPYRAYSIQKRSGGYRFIHAPEESIKAVQSWIVQNILYKLDPHWRCFSFHKNSSIKKCAAEHCYSRWMIKIDIERFFESISEIQVYKVFRRLGYKPLVSFEMARICTIQPKHVLGNNAKRWILYDRSKLVLPYRRKPVKYIGRLPQGAPTSPQLSNLIFSDIDQVFQQIAAERSMVYTRYADDITFSSRVKSFTREDALSTVREVNLVLVKNGFNPQHKKLKIIPPGSRKIILGLTVDAGEPRLSKAYKKRVESHLRGLEVFGIPAHAEHRKFRSLNGMLDHIRGLVGYAIHIDPLYGEKLSHRFIKISEEGGLEL